MPISGRSFGGKDSVTTCAPTNSPSPILNIRAASDFWFWDHLDIRYMHPVVHYHILEFFRDVWKSRMTEILQIGLPTCQLTSRAHRAWIRAFIAVGFTTAAAATAAAATAAAVAMAVAAMVAVLARQDSRNQHEDGDEGFHSKFLSK